MTTYVALLRAVNVGGTGKLPMKDLAALCEDAGFARVETYIASGNVVFDSKGAAGRVKAELEKRLCAYAGKPVGVVLRTADEMRGVLERNPFRKAQPNFSYVIFLGAPPPPDALSNATGVVHEEMRLGVREIYVHYPAGMGSSKLRIPATKEGTARNMNTVAKLADMASRRGGA
jgi:uncharacterized protein (DUF1697 family)